MNVAGGRWYVVHTHAHAEARAEGHLRRQGFATYLPRYRKRRRHARRTETVEAPLFPRYLFVRLDLATQRWRSIQSTVGVSRLVCNGDRPTQVPDAVIADLHGNESEGVVRLPTRPAFNAGDAVCILDGAFAACRGLYDGMKDGERVAILLDLLGRRVRVLLDLESLAAA